MFWSSYIFLHLCKRSDHGDNLKAYMCYHDNKAKEVDNNERYFL